MLRDYMTVLNILMQNPEATFDDVVGSAVTLRHRDNDHEGDGGTDGNENRNAPAAENAPAKTYTIDELDL